MLSFQTKLWLFLALHVGLFFYAVVHWSLGAFIGGYIFARLVGVIGVEIGLHRLWSHHSFKPRRWLELALLGFAVPTLTGSSLAFAGVHRLHHAHSDTDSDPHQPTKILKTFFYIRPAGFSVPPRIVRDLIGDPAHRFVHKNYFLINSGLLLLFLTALGPIATGYSLSFLVVWCFIEIGVVNVAAHLPQFGRRPYVTKDNSSNNRFVRLMVFGHGLHHNHHYQPNRFDFALKKGEVDLPAYLIKGFVKLRWSQLAC